MSNKVLFITGGNGEIGKCIIKRFKNYTIISPSSKELDCSNFNSISNYFNNTSFNKIDAFVHCAGINNIKPFKNITEKSLLDTININCLSFIYIVKFLSKYFIENKSKVVAISSIYGSISRLGRMEYSTSKHALSGAVKSMALEFSERGVLINSISPGFIETSLTYKNNNSDTLKNLISDIPLNKLGDPNDIASLSKFLCSNNNQYITGQNIIIDGGYTIGGFQKF